MTTVPITTLGNDLSVSAVGFGAMTLSGVYGATSDDDALATLHHAVDVGVSFIDTADVYGAGSNEVLISKLLKGRRDEVVLATKFGIAGSIADKTMQARNDSAYVRESVDASLERLGTDVIDLYYLHRRQVTVPIEETVGAMAELVAAGKVRYLGLSEVTAAELEAAHTVHPIAAVQSEWSVWSRDVELAVVPTAARLGVGFVPYSPLGRGFLTGTLTDPATFADDGAPASPASAATRSNATKRSSKRSAPSPPSTTPLRLRSPWPGSTRPAVATACQSSPSPAPGERHASTRMSERSTSPCTPPTSRSSTTYRLTSWALGPTSTTPTGPATPARTPPPRSEVWHQRRE